MPARPYILAESTWPDVLGAAFTTAVLPWGATEAHNRHLPYATDTIQCDAIAAEAARIAWERGARVVVLPTVPFGVNAGQLSIPMTLGIRPETQASVLYDLADALLGQGVRKLLVLNGHGGNEFKAMVRGLQADLPDLFVAVVDWYRALDPSAWFDEPGDHAGEMETALMQHMAPDLVRPLDEAGPGRARPFRVEALRDGWAWSPRHWPSATDDTGVGDPTAATPENGARFFVAVTERLAGLFLELDKLDPDDAYER